MLAFLLIVLAGAGDLEEGEEALGRVELDDAKRLIGPPAGQGLVSHVLAEAPRGQQPKPGHVNDLLHSGVRRYPIVMLDRVALKVQRVEYRQGEEASLVYQLKFLREAGPLVAGQETVRLQQGLDRLVERSLGVTNAVDRAPAGLVFEISCCKLHVLLCGDLNVRQGAAVEADRIHQVGEWVRLIVGNVDLGHGSSTHTGAVIGAGTRPGLLE